MSFPNVRVTNNVASHTPLLDEAGPPAIVGADDFTVGVAVVKVIDEIPDLKDPDPGYKWVKLQVQGQPCRVSFNGVDPTSLKGFVVIANDGFPMYHRRMVAHMRIVRDDTATSDAVVYWQKLKSL